MGRASTSGHTPSRPRSVDGVHFKEASMRTIHLLTAVTAAATLAAPGAAVARSESGPIAFTRYLTSEHQDGAIFTSRVDGRGERQVTRPPSGVSDVQPDWSPDGSRILFERQYPDRPFEIFTVRTDGSGLRQIDPGCPPGIPADQICEELTPAWSPDGRRIAFGRPYGRIRQENGEDTIEVLAITVVRPDGSHARQITQLERPTTSEDTAPTWSPDGRWIAFQRLNITAEPRKHVAVFVVGADGRGLRRLTPWALNGGDHPDWSPDGSRILFHAQPDLDSPTGGALYTVRPDGSRLTRITRPSDAVEVLSSAFSADGKRIVFSRSGVGGKPDIFTIRLDGSDLRPVTRTATWESAPDWRRRP
jgi:Tol biopolymer transport system component